MDVGGGGDRKIKSAPTWISSTLRNGGMKPSALARRLDLKWQGIEMLLDDAETAQAMGTDVIVFCDLNAKMQLGQRDDADSGVGGRVPFESDQHRGIEENACHALLRPGIHQVAAHLFQILHEGGIGRRFPQILQLLARHPLSRASWAELRHRASGNRDRELLTGFRAA